MYSTVQMQSITNVHLHLRATAFAFVCNRGFFRVETCMPLIANAFASLQTHFALSRTHSHPLTVNRRVRCRVETPFTSASETDDLQVLGAVCTVYMYIFCILSRRTIYRVEERLLKWSTGISKRCCGAPLWSAANVFAYFMRVCSLR